MFDKIKELADKKKITLPELSLKMGWSEKAIYSWKNSNPSVDKVEKVADFFGVSVDYILGRDEYWKSYDEQLGEDKLNTIRESVADYELFAAHIDDDLTEEEMEEVLRYIEFIKSKHKK